MKHTLFAITLLALSAAAGKNAYSQNITNHANIPFAFSAGSVDMPAGDYVIQRKPGTNIVNFNDLNTGKMFSAMTREEVTLPMDAPAKLVFCKVGTQHVLASVWQGGMGTEAIFSTAAFEKNLGVKTTKEELVAMQ